MGARLAGVEREIRTQREALDAAMERRRELVVEARDELLWSYGRIARALGLSTARVVRLLGGG